MKKLVLSSILLVGALSCGADNADLAPGSSNAVNLPAGFGKSDNYISTNAAEYTLTGQISVVLPAGFDALDDVAQKAATDEIADNVVDEISRKSRSRIDEILKTPNVDITEAEAKYFIYVKPSYQNVGAAETVVDGENLVITYRLQLVGSAELLKFIIEAEGAEHLKFSILRDGAELEVDVLVSPVPSTDAFPKYNEIFEDDVYDITVIFGGDYNQERYDLETAKWTVQFLIESGWQNDSVTTFEELKADSAPFVLPVTIEGRQVEARVHIIHSQMDDDAGQPQSLLRELVEGAVKRSDVVIYSGHAGAGAGMILDY